MQYFVFHIKSKYIKSVMSQIFKKQICGCKDFWRALCVFNGLKYMKPLELVNIKISYFYLHLRAIKQIWAFLQCKYFYISHVCVR